MKKQLSELIQEKAMSIRWQHQTTDLAVIRQSIEEGVGLALDSFKTQMQREHKAMTLRRERANAHQ